jgi:hypothetical protein
MVLGGSPMVYDRNKTAWFGVLLKRASDTRRGCRRREESREKERVD